MDSPAGILAGGARANSPSDNVQWQTEARLLVGAPADTKSSESVTGLATSPTLCSTIPATGRRGGDPPHQFKRIYISRLEAPETFRKIASAFFVSRKGSRDDDNDLATPPDKDWQPLLGRVPADPRGVAFFARTLLSNNDSDSDKMESTGARKMKRGQRTWPQRLDQSRVYNLKRRVTILSRATHPSAPSFASPSRVSPPWLMRTPHTKASRQPLIVTNSPTA